MDYIEALRARAQHYKDRVLNNTSGTGFDMLMDAATSQALTELAEVLSEAHRRSKTNGKP